MKLDIKPLIKTAKVLLRKNAPTIFTALGVAGAIATPIMATRATFKSVDVIREDSKQKHDGDPNASTKMEIVKATWRYYLPCVITGGLSVACIIGANTIHLKRNAALAAAYALSETAFKDYKNEVIKAIGKKKERDIRDGRNEEIISKNEPSDCDVIETNTGDTLCYDAWSGRYFKSSMDHLRKAQNEANRLMISEGTISMNDLYYEIGLSPIKFGDEFGWDVRKAMINIEFGSHLTPKGRPCIVLDHFNRPFVGFDRFA